MMRSVFAGAILMALAGAAFAVPESQEFLVQVNLESNEQLYTLADRGVRVLAEFDGFCLALLEESEFPVVGTDFVFSVLDGSPQDKTYMIVVPKNGSDRSRLESLGTVIAEDGRALVLRTSEDNILELNRLPVELCHLSMTPMVIMRDEDRPPLESRVLSDSLVTEIVNKVSQDSVLGSIRRLQNFYTRYSTTDSCRAAVNWMLGKMQAYGCDSANSHNYRSGYAPNAVGIKVGQLNPRRQYIICGHIDNTSDQPPNRCPGSDDNASGTTAALEACRVFAGYQFDYTVKFIGFTGEEQGLYGSDSFSAQAYRRHDTILGVLNFDMISYGRQNRDTLLMIGKTTNPNCQALVNAYYTNADTYSDLKCKKELISSGGYGSDHYYFWQRGYVASWGEEDDFTPRYHTIGDTIGTLYYTNCGTNNIPMCTEGIKAAVATLAKLAGVRRLTGTEEETYRNTRWSLAQNRPNPFTRRTEISYACGTDNAARVRVYDNTGKLVRVLHGVRSGPDVTTVWDGRDVNGFAVAPGIYFYRLEGKRTSEFRKAVLATD